MKQGKNQLGKEHSVKISTDSKHRNGKENKSNSDTHSCNIVKKAGIRAPETVQNTFQCSICIKKRADKSQRPYVNPRSFTVKKKISQ